MDLQNIFTFLGGGFVIAIIVNYISVRAVRRQREREWLDRQLSELYAPLFHLVFKSEKLFDLNKRFHDAYKIEYIDVEFSHDEITQERLKERTEKTIALANQYVQQIETINKRISEIFDANFSCIDTDDIEMFLLFYKHHVRFNTERSDGGKIQTPMEVYEHIGDISFLRPEFIERVKSKFKKKQAAIKQLSNE